MRNVEHNACGNDGRSQILQGIRERNGLNAASGYLRNELFARLKIRAVPELIFVLDDSIEYGLKIDRILKELNKDEKK